MDLVILFGECQHSLAVITKQNSGYESNLPIEFVQISCVPHPFNVDFRVLRYLINMTGHKRKRIAHASSLQTFSNSYISNNALIPSAMCFE